MRERASGDRAAIFLSGEARDEFTSGEAASELNPASYAGYVLVNIHFQKYNLLKFSIFTFFLATSSSQNMNGLDGNILVF